MNFFGFLYPLHDEREAPVRGTDRRPDWKLLDAERDALGLTDPEAERLTDPDAERDRNDAPLFASLVMPPYL